MTDQNETDPTGNDPTGNDPTETDPTGNDPTGNDPTGNDPTGNDPTGNDPTGNEIIAQLSSEECHAAARYLPQWGRYRLSGCPDRGPRQRSRREQGG